MTEPQPQSSGPQLLEIRLHALENDVDKVKSVVDKALKGTEPLFEIAGHLHPENDNGMHILLDRLDDISYRVARIMRYPEVRSAIARHARDLPDVLDSELPGHVAQMVEVREAIKNCIDRIAGEANFLVEPQQRLLVDNIEEGCSSLHAQIANILNTLADSGQDPRVYRELWAKFDGKLSEDAQKLFADFVDFIGGLTVRGNALDDQVCTITDRLLDELIPLQVTPDVVLPARQTALGQVMQSVIKMGFPEWTISGIPLVGHEVGLKVARAEIKRDEPNSIKELLTGRNSYGMTHGRLVNLFGDIFAAYKLGPSYANAVIQLRLEPHRSLSGLTDDDPPDGDRAHLILSLLHRLHEHTGLHLDTTYEGAVKTLEKIWEGEASSLSLENAGNTEALNSFLYDAWHALHDSKRSLAFDYAQWDIAQGLQPYLLNGGEKPQAPTIIALLAAVWEARNREPTKTADIERRAKELVVGLRRPRPAWPFGFGGQPSGPSSKETLKP